MRAAPIVAARARGTMRRYSDQGTGAWRGGITFLASRGRTRCAPLPHTHRAPCSAPRAATVTSSIPTNPVTAAIIVPKKAPERNIEIAVPTKASDVDVPGAIHAVGQDAVPDTRRAFIGGAHAQLLVDVGGVLFENIPRMPCGTPHADDTLGSQALKPDRTSAASSALATDILALTAL